MKYAIGIVLLLCLSLQGLRAQSCASADFSISVKKGCAPLVVKFAALNTPPGSTYSWDFGSGATLGQDTSLNAFTVPGKYKITLKVTTQTGSTCVVTKDSVEVLPAPSPILSISPGRFICNGPQKVTFIDNTPDIVDRQWVIDGTTYGNTNSVSHTFVTSGYKSLSLTITNSYGCTTIFTDNRYISINDSASTDFCADIVISDTGYRAKFTPNISGLGTRTVSKYEWTFAGGTPSTSTSKTTGDVKFPDPTKSYDIKLKVTLSDGCTYTVLRKSFLMPYLVPGTDTLCLGTKTTVQNKGAGNNGKGFFIVNFPDANAEQKPPNPNFTVEYFKAGAYGASLTFKYSQNGCINNVKILKYISVLGPKVGFSSSERALCDPTKKVRLENNTDTFGAQNVVYTWRVYDEFDKAIPKWVFGPTKIRDTSFYPGKTGKFGISLSATSTNGCKDSVFQSQFINISRPTATFESDSQVACLGNRITFFSHPDPPEDKPTYNITWNVQHTTVTQIFTTLVGPSPTFKPEYPGKYDISLIIKNGQQCGDTIVKKGYITVNGVVADFNSDKKSGCAGTAVLFTGKVTTKFPNTPQNTLTYLWQVSGADDDAYTIIEKNSLSTYIVFWDGGCYDVILNIIDKQQCTTQVIKEDYLCLGVSSQFDVLPNKCLFDTSEFFVSASRDAHTYKWSVIPSEHAEFYPSDSIRNPQIIYKKDTCFKIQLVTTKNVEGYTCVDTLARMKCIKLPYAGFSSKDTNLYCAPKNVSFKNLSQNAQLFLWEFGDGGTVYNDDTSGTSHVYSRNSIKGWNVRLTALDTNGCSEQFQINNYIKIRGPEPYFEMSERVGCDKVTVAFTNKSVNIQKFNLFYNDGSGIDTNNYSVHTYTLDDEGQDSIAYFPIIIAQDEVGCPAFYEDTVIVYRSPKASFYADTVLACVPYKASFHDVSSGAVRARYWDFNNDGIYDDSSEHATFYYDTPGKYTVKLLVIGKGGCVDSTIYSEYIHIQAIPVAGFVPDKKKFCGKEWVNFADSSHSYIYYIFDYGDGSLEETNVIPPHLYSFTEGKDTGDSVIYIPKVIAYNNAGCTDTFTDTIIVYANPVTGFTANITTGCAPLEVIFTDTGRHVAESYWDFDNNGVIDDTGSTVTHIFGPGIYMVKQKNASGFGCTDSLIKVNYVQVNEPPTASYTSNKDTICVGEKISFTDLSYPKANVIKWYWKFNEPLSINGDTSILQHPEFRFYTQGWHQVRLIVEDNKGCVDTFISQSVYVEDTLTPANSSVNYVSVNENGQVDISWNQNKLYDFEEYRIYRNTPADYQIHSTKHFSDTLYMDNDPLLSTLNNSYCYYVKTVDKCGNTSSASGMHCTVLLNAIAISPTKTRLSWSSYVGWSNVAQYKIYRAGGDKIYKEIAFVPGDVLIFNDSDLCDENYCYYVVAIHPTAGYTSRSNISCVKPSYVYQTEPIDLQYATVFDNNKIKLKWLPAAPDNTEAYLIDRFSENEGWKISHGQTNDTVFYDASVDVFASSYTYRIRPQDICGYLGPYSNNSRSILLTNKIVDDKISLNWNKYGVWKNGVNRYELQIRKRNGQFKTIAIIPSTDSSYIDDSVYTEIDTTYCYRIIARDNTLKNLSSVSNTSCAILLPRVFAPNAFSPNKDSLNEEWKPLALFIYNKTASFRDYNLKVFDRWGSLVFESGDVNHGWNGAKNGIPLPVGVYIYTVNATGLNGENIYLKGNITLLK